VGEKDFKIGEYFAKLQERDRLVHFASLANTLLKDGESFTMFHKVV